MTDYKIIEKVPVDYYQKGIKSNYLQGRWHRGKLRAVTEMIDYSPARVLDVGCASGWFLSELSEKLKDSSLYGIDIYKDAIDYGKRNYPKISFFVRDAEQTKFDNEYFNLIITTEVIEHLENPVKALREMKRILKKDGRLIIEVDSGSLLFSVAWYIWRKSKGNVWNDSHLHSFNIKKLEKVSKEVGFKILKKKKFNFGMAMIFLLEK